MSSPLTHLLVLFLVALLFADTLHGQLHQKITEYERNCASGSGPHAPVVRYSDYGGTSKCVALTKSTSRRQLTCGEHTTVRDFSSSNCEGSSHDHTLYIGNIDRCTTANNTRIECDATISHSTIFTVPFRVNNYVDGADCSSTGPTDYQYLKNDTCVAYRHHPTPLYVVASCLDKNKDSARMTFYSDSGCVNRLFEIVGEKKGCVKSSITSYPLHLSMECQKSSIDLDELFKVFLLVMLITGFVFILLLVSIACCAIIVVFSLVLCVFGLGSATFAAGAGAAHHQGKRPNYGTSMNYGDSQSGYHRMGSYQPYGGPSQPSFGPPQPSFGGHAYPNQQQQQYPQYPPYSAQPSSTGDYSQQDGQQDYHPPNMQSTSNTDEKSDNATVAV